MSLSCDPLVSSTEEDHDLIPFSTVVDPVARPEVDPQLEHFTHAPGVAEVAEAEPPNPSPDPRPCHPVPEPSLPIGVGLDAIRSSVEPNFDLIRHRRTVA
jgi:hypothetical protein